MDPSGVIPPARTDSASDVTASQLCPTNDHRHEHLPASPGVIPSPRTDLASSHTASLIASQPRSPSDHSHGPLPVSPGVISRADLASGPAVPSTTSRLRSASSLAHSSTTPTLLPPLGTALTSFLSASPSLSASAPGVAELSASQSTLRRRLSSPALASSLSSGPRS